MCLAIAWWQHGEAVDQENRQCNGREHDAAPDDQYAIAAAVT
jgi:hypothetical protein